MPMKQRGFTLIELLITVVIAAIVLTIAVPGFQTVILNNRRATQVNEFVTNLNLARAEAIKGGRQVFVCRSSSGTACATDTSSVWEDGWIVFVDRDDDDTLDAGETIRVQAAFEGDSTLRGPANFSQWISYFPTGISRGNGGLANGTLTLCDKRGDSEARNIVLSSTGRVSINDTVASGTCP